MTHIPATREGIGKAGPDVSVIMPIRNGADTVRESLESVLSQTLQTIEIIAIDDGSTDATPAILQEFAHDRRLRVERREPNGIVAALRTGVALARAPLIARLDADDLAFPTRLAEQAQRFREQPTLVLLGTAVDTIDWQGRTIGRLAYPTQHAALVRALRRRNPLVHSTVMFRRAAYDQVGGYRTALQLAEDFDLWCRMAEVGTIGNLSRRLAAYRQGPQTYSSNSRLQQSFVFAVARRCASLRAAGERDPLREWMHPIDIDTSDLPRELQREQVFFQLLQQLRRSPGAVDASHCRLLAKLAWKLDRNERRLAQDALLFHMGHSPHCGPWHRLSTWLDCAQLDPWRLSRAIRKAA